MAGCTACNYSTLELCLHKYMYNVCTVDKKFHTKKRESQVHGGFNKLNHLRSKGKFLTQGMRSADRGERGTLAQV